MKNFVKSIAIAMVMSAGAFNANAQNVVTGISTQDFNACREYLTIHPQDTIRTSAEYKLELAASADTTVTRNEGLTVIELKAGDKMYFSGVDVFMSEGLVVRGNHYTVVRVNHLPAKAVADSSIVAKVDNAAEQTQVALISRSYGQDQDVNFYQSNVHKTTDGKVVDKAMNKNGMSFFADGGYRRGEADIHSFTGEAGLQITADWGAVLTGSFRLATGKYPSNAVEANGSYLTYGFKAGAGWQFALDRYAVWHLYLLAGIGLDFQKTETAKNENGLLQSSVSALYPWARVKVAYEPFNWRVGLFFSAGWEQNQILSQNLGNAGKNCGAVEVGFTVPLFRSWVKTVK
jgi:hypothetical protein